MEEVVPEELDKLRELWRASGKLVVVGAPTCLTTDEQQTLRAFAARHGVSKATALIGFSLGTYYSAAAGGRISARVATAVRKVIGTESDLPEAQKVTPPLTDAERASIKRIGVRALSVTTGLSVPTIYAAANGARTSERVAGAIRAAIAAEEADAIRADRLTPEEGQQLQNIVWKMGIDAAAAAAGSDSSAVICGMQGTEYYAKQIALVRALMQEAAS